MGFEVAAMLEDGSDVLQFLEENRADVLLTDICMFQVSGLEAAAKIREKYPWMRVVLLSGYREFEYAREALRCQVYDYLLKPIDYEKLREVFGKIREELDGQKREEQMLRSFGERNMTGTGINEGGGRRGSGRKRGELDCVCEIKAIDYRRAAGGKRNSGKASAGTASGSPDTERSGTCKDIWGKAGADSFL